MGKKSKGGGKKKQNKEDKDVLPEVDKEFYEIQLTDLNQKLSRLRSRCAELETENEDIKGNLNKLDEDRADIIAYLQRTLQAKADEIMELQERLTALQQERDAERTSFLDKIKNMEHEFKVMHEQLTSEIKLLNGKLNSLEEFRSQREELMNKYLIQEEAMEEQEKRHKIQLYEVERKFIVGKDELKKDMESKLLQLSLDFQNTTDIRIAATTQRVIRENVAINNELRILMESWKKLKDDHEELKKKEKEMKLEVEIYNEEKISVLKKSAVQTKIIDRLSEMYHKLIKAYDEFEHTKRCVVELDKKVTTQIQELLAAKKETGILKQVLNARDIEENEREINLQNAIKQILELKEIIQTAALAVTEAIGVRAEPGSDTSLNLSRRQGLLTMLLEIFNKTNDMKEYELEDKISLETISLKNYNMMDTYTYSSGDLGLMPKPVGHRSTGTRLSNVRKSNISNSLTKSSSDFMSIKRASRATGSTSHSKSISINKSINPNQ